MFVDELVYFSLIYFRFMKFRLIIIIIKNKAKKLRNFLKRSWKMLHKGI